MTIWMVDYITLVAFVLSSLIHLHFPAGLTIHACRIGRKGYLSTSRARIPGGPARNRFRRASDRPSSKSLGCLYTRYSLRWPNFTRVPLMATAEDAPAHSSTLRHAAL